MRLHKPPKPLRIARRPRLCSRRGMGFIMRLQRLEIPAERQRSPIHMHAAAVRDQLTFSEGFRLSSLSASAFFLSETPVIAACRIDQAICAPSMIGRLGKV